MCRTVRVIKSPTLDGRGEARPRFSHTPGGPRLKSLNRVPPVSRGRRPRCRTTAPRLSPASRRTAAEIRGRLSTSTTPGCERDPRLEVLADPLDVSEELLGRATVPGREVRHHRRGARGKHARDATRAPPSTQGEPIGQILAGRSGEFRRTALQERNSTPSTASRALGDARAISRESSWCTGQRRLERAEPEQHLPDDRDGQQAAVVAIKLARPARTPTAARRPARTAGSPGRRHAPRPRGRTPGH